ncbi:MAG: gene transfer agent family protein [Methylocystis sp.]
MTASKTAPKAVAKTTVLYAHFAGKRRRFCLRLGEVGELEQLCEAGVGAILKRFALAEYRFADVRETIRLGLIGGDNGELGPGLADILMENYVDSRPLGENAGLAAQILHALIEGIVESAGALPKKAPEETTNGPATSPP